MGDWTGTWSYGYDDNNRLTSATAPNPVPDQPAGGNYGYDWVGNRLNPPTGTNHMVYNAADQLTAWPGMHTYTYNGDGSMHEVKTGQTTVASYTYTPDGLLSAASYNDRTLSNTWDASKNRVSFTADSTTHTFVFDTTAGIPAVIDEDGVYYVREPDGSLIARISGSDMSYYHFDSLGSTRLLTDSDGDVTDKYAYDAYGSLITHDELTGHVDQPYQYVGRLGYYTHYQEPEFGLLQLGVRFYDAQVGMFTSRDIYKDGLNWYVYTNDNPIVSVDPSGKTCYKCWRRMYVGPVSGLWHAFLWCDNNNNGYDSSDPVLGMTGKNTGGLCLDTDKSYLKDEPDGKGNDVQCDPIANQLSSCISDRISRDKGRKCSGNYNIVWNNCQEYAYDVVSDCAEKALKSVSK